jgi:hypothetical protein
MVTHSLCSARYCRNSSTDTRTREINKAIRMFRYSRMSSLPEHRIPVNNFNRGRCWINHLCRTPILQVIAKLIVAIFRACLIRKVDGLNSVLFRRLAVLEIVTVECRVAFWESGLSNRPKRPHVRPIVNVRIIGLETRDSYVARFSYEFCKTRQVCNANRKSDSKEATSDGTARQETL